MLGAIWTITNMQVDILGGWDRLSSVALLHVSTSSVHTQEPTSSAPQQELTSSAPQQEPTISDPQKLLLVNASNLHSSIDQL
jgi:hypothetical protein